MAKYCPNCGKEVLENAVVCVNCGSAVNTNNVNSINNTNTTVDPNSKSKIAAGLLGIFLGCIGVHNFYLGYTGKAVGQLLLTVLSCGILSPISAIWGLIEGILILTGSINTDAKGNKLSE